MPDLVIICGVLGSLLLLGVAVGSDIDHWRNGGRR